VSGAEGGSSEDAGVEMARCAESPGTCASGSAEGADDPDEALRGERKKRNRIPPVLHTFHGLPLTGLEVCGD
jgi:hypothetical protein